MVTPKDSQLERDPISPNDTVGLAITIIIRFNYYTKYIKIHEFIMIVLKNLVGC